jgi:ketosteroid isomerase-like protein
MRKMFFVAAMAAILISCNNKKEKDAASTGDGKNSTVSNSDLPYTATFPGNFSQDVSEADLKSVMQSYKEWENGDMVKTAGFYGDSVMWQRNNGDKKLWSNADLMKEWSTYRDSLSKVVIQMDAWDKAYEINKKESYVLTWYREYDTYKSGKVDSGDYHDVNLIKDGKIVYYSQYRRALK